MVRKLDRSQFVRTETIAGKKHYVMMDEKGPGAIVRIWGTWDGPRGGKFSDGTLSVFLDGNQQPVIQGPISKVLSGQLLAPAPISQGVSPSTEPARRGHNLFLPIPYSKSCKVTYTTDALIDPGARKGEALYYQINFRTYQKDTNVRSLTKEELAGSKNALQKVAKAIQNPFEDPKGSVLKDFSRKDGQWLFSAGGSKVVDRIQLKPNFDGLSEKEIAQQLRSTILKVSFDGQPCVWCPLGAFFGSGYQHGPQRTWYTRVTKNGGFECYWKMPFRKSCEMELVTLSGKPIQLANGRVVCSDYQWTSRSMHFHAGWNLFRKLPTGKNKWHDGNSAFDLNYVELKGQGVLVGDSLSVFNPSTAWWGEGDEKIYVDGESFPSHFGTGTEDYYGYAWCRPETFSAPFHSQPIGQGNLTPGYTVTTDTDR